MQIQTIEEKTGLDRATIRYYEQEGLIKPLRLQNGYRDYSEKHLEDLMKIKLLRQLGLSLETIQQLIEGREELQHILSDQLIVIKAHKDHLESAESVCKMMIQDKITYQTIQPSRYFNAIENKQCAENKIIDTQKTEYVYCEVHPARRFIGRYLDHLFASALLMLIVVVLIRVRPVGDFINTVIDIGALLLSMLLNAFFLCIFGTTPGKFAMGIYIKNPEGKKLSFLASLRREWAVFRYGEGFHIPIYSWYRMYKSYQLHTAGLELEWDYDYDADVLYTQWSTRRSVLASILAIICSVGIIVSVQDSAFPKHRETDLTVSQFAENYNGYAKQNDMHSLLSDEGEWYRLDHPNPDVILDAYGVNDKWEFITDDNGYLDLIKINIQTDSGFIITADSRASLAIFTAIMSQPGADINEADSAVSQFSELTIIDYKTPIFESKFCDVTVKWELQKIRNGSDTLLDLHIEIIMP